MRPEPLIVVGLVSFESEVSTAKLYNERLCVSHPWATISLHPLARHHGICCDPRVWVVTNHGPQ
jgi:hypothetical protein